jgi:hypothetical protein
MDSNTYQLHWHSGKHKKVAGIEQNLYEKLCYFMIASIYQFQWLDAQMLLKPRRICPVITICLLCQQRIKNAVSFKVPSLKNSPKLPS